MKSDGTLSDAELLGNHGFSGAGSMAFAQTGFYDDIYSSSGSRGTCYNATLNASAYVDGSIKGSNSWGSWMYCVPAPDDRPCASCTLQRSEFCPLVIDATGDGIRTLGLDTPVSFFTSLVTGDYVPSGWLDPAANDAFLWIDLDANGSVTEEELFGSKMVIEGVRARNGYQALERYDSVQRGGNADGQITSDDAVWRDLRLWFDANADGKSVRNEIRLLESYRITQIGLNRSHQSLSDGFGNSFMLVGSATQRNSARDHTARLTVVDIGFNFVGD